MSRWIFEGRVEDVDYEDGGQAAIAHITEDPPVADEGGFVRLQSWSEATPPTHPFIDEITGRRVRVTVEVIES